jgi:class 3 adenylate cyclase
MGDGLLIEFESPVKAVRTAMTIQRAMTAHQADLPEDRRLRFRIGINLGDVVIDGDDVLGDCVNIAARLETLAPVGGSCISRAVYDQARGRVAAEMTALEPQKLKNIPESIDVW